MATEQKIGSLSLLKPDNSSLHSPGLLFTLNLSKRDLAGLTSDPPSCYPELSSNISHKVKLPSTSTLAQPHPLLLFPSSTPIMIFRPCFYTLTLLRHPHSPGPRPTPTQHCFTRGGMILCFPWPHGTPPLLGGDPKLHVDWACS